MRLKHLLLFIVLAGFSTGSLFSQVRQVIVGNGGNFSDSTNNVTVGTFDPILETYTQFGTASTGSVQDVLIEGDFAYVSAESMLLKYNIVSHQLVDSTSVPGIQKLAVYGNQLVVTRGFGTIDNFVQVYNQSDLSLAYSIPQVSDESKGVVVVGDSAYVSVPGSFLATVGKMAIIDLDNETFMREVDFDTLGAQATSVWTDGSSVFLINSINFFSAYGTVTEYEIANQTSITTVLSVTAGGGVGFQDDLIYATFGGNIGSYDIVGDSVLNPMVVAGSFVGGTMDTLNEVFYLTDSDYATYGTCYIYDLNGAVLDSFAVNVAPEALAVDYSSSVGREEVILTPLAMTVFPNPVDAVLNVKMEGISGSVQVRLCDLAGRLIQEQTADQVMMGEELHMNVSSLPAGSYLVEVIAGNQRGVSRMIKQ